MRQVIKRVVSEFPWLYECLLDLKYFNRPINECEPPGAANEINSKNAEVFAEMLARNAWADPISKSGPGSNLQYTHKLRQDLQKLLRAYSVGSMLDAPCGDFIWMKEVCFPDEFAYIGGDIVTALVDDLNTKYGEKNRRFTTLDVTTDPLPKVDLWLCRDCLIHLSNKDAILTLRNFANSEIGLLLTTTYNFGTINTDIPTGGFRRLNLLRPPFSLPSPLRMVRDYVFPFPPRRLALWSRDQIRAWAEKRSS